MNAPRISVLIPTYNYARYLPEAIESVLCQEFKDFELLIVDDCSSDNTTEVVQAYCQRDSRLHFSVNSPNLGMVNNWNFCLREARGEYIKMLFGDDRLCHPQALGKWLALLEKYPSATLAASARAVLDDNSKPVDIYRSFPDGCHAGQEIIREYLRQNGKNLVGEPSAVMFRKSDALRGFDPQYRQIVDVEMWFHLLEKGDLAYTGEPLCGFRCHDLQEGERNAASGLGPREHADFFSKYAVEHDHPPDVLHALLFPLRRKISKQPDPAYIEAEQRLLGRLGNGWRWSYWMHCLRYRLAKPFRNLAHSMEKRQFRRTFKLPLTKPQR